MAMVFTLVSQLQESIQDLVSTRIKRREQEGADAAKREVEVCASLIVHTIYVEISRVVERRGPHTWNPCHPHIVRGMETEVRPRKTTKRCARR